MVAGDPKRKIVGIYYIPAVIGAKADALKINPAVANNPLIFPTAKMLDSVHKYPKILEAYSSCLATVENGGHRFGTDLSDADKKALIAFLATL